MKVVKRHSVKKHTVVRMSSPRVLINIDDKKAKDKENRSKNPVFNSVVGLPSKARPITAHP